MRLRLRSHFERSAPITRRGMSKDLANSKTCQNIFIPRYPKLSEGVRQVYPLSPVRFLSVGEREVLGRASNR